MNVEEGRFPSLTAEIGDDLSLNLESKGSGVSGAEGDPRCPSVGIF